MTDSSPATLVVRIKPHHFVDILRDVGRGQTSWPPHPYGHALHMVAARILADPDAVLEVELGADAICGPCIHNVAGLCDDVIDTSFRPAAPASKREWNLLLDRRWCESLGLAHGQRLTARQFAERLHNRLGDLPAIYREVPLDRVAARAGDLRRGIERFLSTVRDRE